MTDLITPPNKHTAGREPTYTPLAFRALLPNLHITNEAIYALLNERIAEHAWISHSHLLMEFQKSYPDAQLTSITISENGQNLSRPAIRFTGDSLRSFAADFMQYQENQAAKSIASRTR